MLKLLTGILGALLALAGTLMGVILAYFIAYCVIIFAKRLRAAWRSDK